MKYQQLTQEQRYQIGACLKIGMNKSQIAREIKVHRSTITRELRRNNEGGRYRPAWAIRLARERQQSKRKHRIEEVTWRRVDALLKLEWSPQQISERLKLEGWPTISHETVYLHVYQNKREGGDLYTHLRRRHQYRKRAHKYGSRNIFWYTRRPISERPAIVDKRSRIGDWEADTIIGSHHTGAILSLVERRSRLCVLQKVATTAAWLVAEAVCQKLSPIKDKVLTITSDNGVEFFRHQDIAASLGADFFFADPYASWQRGTNENTNGLIRQYFPKKSSFTSFSDRDVQLVSDLLNNRPRRVLGYKTPNEVFNNYRVALIT